MNVEKRTVCKTRSLGARDKQGLADERFMAHGSRLVAQGSKVVVQGLRLIAKQGAIARGPQWAVSHEPLTINNRLINRLTH